MKLKYYILGIIIILIDQLSKFLMINKKIAIIQNFVTLQYTENTGAAFSIGSNTIILVLSILLIVGIISFLIIKKDKINDFIPFILIISGSIGNLIDRIFRGYVIDFININIFNFPIFNIADICIVLGFIYLIIKIFISNNDKSKDMWYITIKEYWKGSVKNGTN